MKRKSLASAAGATGPNSSGRRPFDHNRRRLAQASDLGGVCFRLVLTDEDESVGHTPEDSFGGKIEAAGERSGVIVEAAAVRGIDAGYARTRCPQQCADDPRVGAALGAVAVQDIGIERTDFLHQPQGGREVRRRQLPAHRRTFEAEGKEGRHFGDDLFRERRANRGVADDADRVAGAGLSLGEVADVAKQAADWRAEAVYDLQRPGVGRRSAGAGHQSMRIVQPHGSEKPLTHVECIARSHRVGQRKSRRRRRRRRRCG